jgi:hypothetical protein
MNDGGRLGPSPAFVYIPVRQLAQRSQENEDANDDRGARIWPGTTMPRSLTILHFLWPSRPGDRRTGKEQEKENMCLGRIGKNPFTP